MFRCKKADVKIQTICVDVLLLCVKIVPSMFGCASESRGICESFVVVVNAPIHWSINDRATSMLISVVKVLSHVSERRLFLSR